MRLFFAYDNEDWVTPATDDICLYLAEIHAKHGAKATFYTVAERARALRHRGRDDVIDALASHEIAYHLDTHGHLPRSLAVYCDELGWERGLAEIMRIEGRGLRDVADIFGQVPTTWCQGECNWAPQAVRGLSLLGISSWTGSLFGTPDGMPAWYMGQLCVRRAMHIVSVQPEPGDDALFERFRANFDAKLDAKPSDSFVYVFGHPCRWGSQRWWGQDQWTEYHDGRVRAPTDLKPVRERYSASQVDALLGETDRCIEWVMSRDDLTPTTYVEVNAACAEPSRQWLMPEQLRRCADRVGDTFSYAEVGETTLSPADLLAALAWALVREERGGAMPERIPLRRPLGPLAEPAAAARELTTTRGALRAACYTVDREIEHTGAVPSRVRVGESDIGPADLLRVCCRLMGGGLDTASVKPGPVLPEIATTQCFEETRFDSWSHPKGFSPTYLTNLAKWQSWTFRPAIVKW